MNKKKLLYALLFTAIGLALANIKFSEVVGSKVSFTLFDFYGPVLAALLGVPLGLASVFAVGLAQFAMGGGALTTAAVIRLFPTMFAAYYFSLNPQKRQSKWFAALPLLCIAAFWLHPEGRQAWPYALFWLIPVVAYFKRDWLLVRSLGATFTAHAVGGAAWVWALNLPAAVWMSLIPVVAAERLLIATGISASYLSLSKLASWLDNRNLLPSSLAHLKQNT